MMTTKKRQDRVDIYIPKETWATMELDARRCELFRKNGETINLNQFLNRILIGYYSTFREECTDFISNLKETIRSCGICREESIQKLSALIMEKVYLAKDAGSRRGSTEKLPLRFTEATYPIYNEICQFCNEGITVQKYLASLMIRYTKLPFFERERILFSRETKALEKACREKKIVFLTTKTNASSRRQVIPYKIVHGIEEMQNYLLCEDITAGTRKSEPKGIRLCRIRITEEVSEARGTFRENVLEILRKMESAPQFIPNGKLTLVRMSENGQKMFREKFFLRPVPDGEPRKTEDGTAIYYFSASADQLYRYFLSFSPNDAEVLSPQKLRNRLLKFYQTSFQAYRNPPEFNPETEKADDLTSETDADYDEAAEDEKKNT